MIVVSPPPLAPLSKARIDMVDEYIQILIGPAGINISMEGA
jgi:hypothetical protein